MNHTPELAPLGPPSPAAPGKSYSASRSGDDIEIGGLPVISLRRRLAPQATTPQFVSAEIVPGRGMNVFQLRAFLPGRGITELLHSPTLEEFRRSFEQDKQDIWGNAGFFTGGALLLPYANRVRGRAMPGDPPRIEARILGRPHGLPANWRGQRPGAERVSMHGMILDKAFANLELDAGPDHASVTGILDAGDFDGAWPSRLRVEVTVSLTGDRFVLHVRSTNVGTEPTVVGVGWHPYFRILSGDRTQARLRIPALRRMLMNNADDVFPTGELELLGGTAHDFADPHGRALGALALDDGFVDLLRDRGPPTVELRDPAATYGLRVRAVSPTIRAFQVFAPPDQAFAAIEPQFNYGDPFGLVWRESEAPVDTGMVKLAPRESTVYCVELELL